MTEHAFESELAEFRRRWYQAHVERWEAAGGAPPDDWLAYLRQQAPRVLASLEELARSDDLEAFVEAMQSYSREGTGFKGYAGQIFLRNLSKETDDSRATSRLLAEVLRPPRDSAEAHRKISNLAAEVRRIGAGRLLAPGYSAFLASYFWYMANPLEWPIAWRYSIYFIEYCTGTYLPSSSEPADRYLRLLEAIRAFDNDIERFHQVRSMYIRKNHALLDSVLVDRCRFGLNRDIDPAALLANADALVAVSRHIGETLRDEVSEASGIDLKYKKLPRMWNQDGPGRSDLWVDWRLPVEPKGPAIRVWVNQIGRAHV